MKNTIQLSDHFDYSRLIRFTLPSIIMMIFTSIYGVVDGYFVSNFVGKTPFAAVNFITPLIMILGSVGFMFGAGGGAQSGRGQKRTRPAAVLIIRLCHCYQRYSYRHYHLYFSAPHFAADGRGG